MRTSSLFVFVCGLYWGNTVTAWRYFFERRGFRVYQFDCKNNDVKRNQHDSSTQSPLVNVFLLTCIVPPHSHTQTILNNHDHENYHPVQLMLWDTNKAAHNTSLPHTGTNTHATTPKSKIPRRTVGATWQSRALKHQNLLFFHTYIPLILTPTHTQAHPKTPTTKHAHAHKNIVFSSPSNLSPMLSFALYCRRRNAHVELFPSHRCTHPSYSSRRSRSPFIPSVHVLYCALSYIV